MSKFRLVENKKSKQFLISLPLLFILALGFLTLLPLQKANALSPSFAQFTVASGICTNCANEVGGSYDPTGAIGLTYIYESTCIPYTASITGITDTRGNTWTKIASISTRSPLQPSVQSPYIDMWTAIQVSTAITSNVITANLASSGQTCVWGLYISNQPMSLISFSGSSASSIQSNPLGTVPKLNSKVQSNNFTFTGTGQYAVFNFASSFSTAGAVGESTNFVSAAPSAPLVPVGTDIICAGGLQDYVNCGTSQTAMSPNGVTLNQRFNVVFHSANSPPNPTAYNYGMITAVFTTNKITPPSCTSCGTGGGGTDKDKTTTFSISMPNETLLYTFDAPVGGNLIQNITTEVSSYTNGGAGKSIDFIYICIYELPSGTLASLTPISSTNQLKQTSCILSHSISTGQVNQYIHWYPNIQVPPSTTFAISILSRFSGLNIYASTTLVQLLGDTADYTGTSGTPPLALSNFFNVSPPIFFAFTGSQTPILSTITATTTVTFCTAGATCIISTDTQYNTQTVTSLIYSMNGANGAVANIQDLVSFLPVWVLPLVMGSLFGVIGLLFGGVVGLGMGVMLGIIPLWFAFLLGLGIVFILFKRVI